MVAGVYDDAKNLKLFVKFFLFLIVLSNQI